MARVKKIEKRYKYYNYSSNAYAYEPTTVPSFYEDERRKQIKKEERIIKAAKRKIVLHKLTLVFSIGIIFAGCFIVMACNAAVDEQRIKNSMLKNELATMKMENTTLQSEISDSVDLDYIRREAMERLGMAEPQQYQIVYIDVPRQSYNIQYSRTNEAEEEKFSFKKLINLFKK